MVKHVILLPTHTSWSIYPQSDSSRVALCSLQTGINSVVSILLFSVVPMGFWTWLRGVSQKKVRTLPNKDYERGIAYTRSPMRWTGKESHQWLRPKTQPAKKQNNITHFDLLLYFLKYLGIIVPVVARLPFLFDAH